MMLVMDETREKLAKETKNLDTFKHLLSKSNRQTKEMCQILSQFDNRLGKLEETIAPVYEETGNLQKRQENIMKSIEKLDYVIKYYNVASEVQHVVRCAPSADTLSDYLSTMDKLKNTLCYFEQNNPHSAELKNVSLLYEDGAQNVLKEFRQLFNRYAKPLTQVQMFDLVHEDEANSSHSSTQSTDKPTEKMPESVKNQLSLMSEWLCFNKRDEFVTLYAEIKSETLQKSINVLKDHQKNASGGNFTFSSSPSLLRRNLARADAARRTPKGIQQALKKKFQDVLLADIVTGKTHTSSTAEVREEPPISEKEIVSYLTCVTALYKLMQIELRQIQEIVPNQHQKAIFSKLIASTIKQIVDEGESLANRVKRATQRHDFSSALNLFPILRHQAAMRHNFDLIFEGCATDVQNKFQGLVVVLQTTINHTLEKFIEFIKNDIDTKVPRDGTVHELTSNIMLFIVQLLNYLDILARVITVTDFVSIENNSDKNRIAYAQYINRVLAAVAMTLNNKSQSYSDPYLKSIFMLNNYHYILKTLRKSTLLEIVHLFNPKIEQFYEEQILENKKIYSQSWSRVLSYILEMDKSQTLPQPRFAPEMMNMKLKDKDRRNIKDKFSGFNKEIEEIRKIQTGYAIPDAELCQSLKRANQEFIVPKYKYFYDKYSAMNFAKNVEKYVKYSPSDVADIINTFFDSAA